MKHLGLATTCLAAAALIGAAPSGAAQSATFRVSFYGVQRYSTTTTSRENPASGCFDRQIRGTETGLTVARFESARPTRLTITRSPGLPDFRYPPAQDTTFPLPARGTWTTSGSTGYEQSSCIDGARIWSPVPAPAHRCGSAAISGLGGSVMPQTAGTLQFAGGHDLGMLGDPLAGCAYGEHQYGLYQARGRYSSADLLDPRYAKHLLVLRSHTRTTTPFRSTGGVGTTTVDMRTTVYVTFVRVRTLAASAATAHAGSIVYAKANAVWVTSPDGKHRARVTSGGKYASPSQADDGTIVALGADNHLYRLTRRGKLRNPPVATWLGLGGGNGFSGPYRTRVSPDGKKVAFTVLHVEGVDPVSGNSEIEGITSYSYADRPTPPGKLGLVKGWDNPAWIDNRHTMAFNPGADEFPGGVNVAYHELGHADPNALDDMHHAYTWFDDPGASTIVFGDITRRGDKLAAGEDGFSATRTIRLYSVAARPPYRDDAPVYRCRLTNPPGAGFESVSWSPDGQSLAYQAGGSIYTVRVGAIAHGCRLGRPRLLVAGGTSPSWGPAGVR